MPKARELIRFTGGPFDRTLMLTNDNLLLTGGLDLFKNSNAGSTLILVDHEQILMAIHLYVYIKHNLYARVTPFFELSSWTRIT
jgi:hypothetical protein